MLDPNKIPSGLSWGMRGFRIGKSAYGNWWISLGLPFGFRYTWMLGKQPMNKSKPQIEESSQIDSTNEIIESSENNKPNSRNQEILSKMKR
jgi:hypothetical protein